MKEFYCFIIKRDNQILVKGLSKDKISWYLLPMDKRTTNFHPHLLKYFNEGKCLKQIRCRRNRTIRLTKETRSTYLNDDMECVFEGNLLEKDDNLQEDSIYQQLNDELTQRDCPFNSTANNPQPFKII